MEVSKFHYIIPIEKIANLEVIKTCPNTRQDPSDRNFILTLYPSGLIKYSGDMSFLWKIRKKLSLKFSMLKYHFWMGAENCICTERSVMAGLT